MRVRVVYFASARDASGKSREQVSIEGSPRIEDLAGRLQRLHPGLGKLHKSIRYSVNLEIVEANHQLREGDEIGVLPAVTGG
ncbi:MAG TPA: MoaD/ThiS family protein [Nitrososphaerales archaeon]|nr:MoaD/ThiS family protein [Nitrososphaerales archaeon]